MAVYVIQAGDGGPVKIGTATHPRRRLSALQTGHWLPLRVICEWPGDAAIERAMHKLLREFHLGGEWFRSAPAILDGSIYAAAVEAARPEEERTLPAREYSPGVRGDLLRRIDTYCAETGTSARAFSLAVTRDHKWLARVRHANVNLSSIVKAEALLDEYDLQRADDGPNSSRKTSAPGEVGFSVSRVSTRARQTPSATAHAGNAP